MALASSKLRRLATGFRAICVGTQKRASAGAGPLDQDFTNAPAAITRLDKGVFTLPAQASMPAGTSLEVSATVPNAQIGLTLDGTVQNDLVHLNPPAVFDAGLLVGSARVTGPQTITFRLTNNSAGAIVPSLAIYQYFLVRS